MKDAMRTIIIECLALAASAAEHVTQTSDGITERYSDNDGLIDGAYTATDHTGRVIIRGQASHGVPTGDWQFFDVVLGDKTKAPALAQTITWKDGEPVSWLEHEVDSFCGHELKSSSDRLAAIRRLVACGMLPNSARVPDALDIGGRLISALQKARLQER